MAETPVMSVRQAVGILGSPAQIEATERYFQNTEDLQRWARQKRKKLEAEYSRKLLLLRQGYMTRLETIRKVD